MIFRTVCRLRELNRSSHEQVTIVVTGSIRLAPLRDRYVRVVVRLLRLVTLLDEGAKLQCVGIMNFSQVIGNGEAAIRRKDRISISRKQITTNPAAPGVNDTHRNKRVLAIEIDSIFRPEANLLQAESRVRHFVGIRIVVMEIQLAGAKQNLVGHGGINDIRQINYDGTAKIIALELAGEFVVR